MLAKKINLTKLLLLLALATTLFSPSLFAASKLTCKSTVSDARSQKIWRNVKSIVNKNLRLKFNNNKSLLLQDIKSDHLQWLVKLGFKISENLSIKLPDFKDLTANYNQLIEDIVFQWNQKNPQNQILDNHIIRPAFPFKNSLGMWMFIPFGRFIPPGFEPIYDWVPGRGLYLSLQLGYFPLSANIIFHDLAHLTSYLQYPNYMKGYQQLANYIIENGGWDFLKQNPGLKGRVFYFNESLILISKEKLKNHLHLFTLPSQPAEFGSRGYSFYQIYAELSPLSINETLSISRKLLKILPDITEALGGAARDGVNGRLKSKSFHILNALKENLLRRSLLQPNVSRQQAEIDLKTSLAEMQAAILILSESSLETWKTDMIQAQAPSVSAANYLFSKKSGVFVKKQDEKTSNVYYMSSGCNYDEIYW